MRIAQSELNDLFAKFGAHVPELEIIEVRCPGDVTSLPEEGEVSESVAGTHKWSFLANSNPDGKAEIEVVVEVIDGPHRGEESDWLSPDAVDTWLASLPE